MVIHFIKINFGGAKTLTHTIARRITLLVVFAAALARCWALDPAPDPTRLFGANTPVFLPGNAGESAFLTTAPAQLGKLAYNEERAAKGQVIVLFSREYDFSPAANDAESTQPAGYWIRLASTIVQAAQFGMACDCRVTTELLTELQEHGASIGDFSMRFARMLSKGLPPPLISVDLPRESDANSVLSTLRRDLPACKIGILCRTPTQLDECRDFDFAVVAESCLPPQYAVQAATSYIRSRVGQLPIIMQRTRPQFYKELFWTATGAAAIQYAKDLPSPGTPEHRIAWRNLRSICSFPRWLGGTFHPANDLAQPGVFGAIVNDDHSAAFLLLRNAKLELQLPELPPDKPEFIATWFNPVTDEYIVTPRTVAPLNRKIHVATPSADPWIYLHTFAPASTDRDSTQTLILPEPPEPPDVDEDQTTRTKP